jgi:hypothetical protein
MSKNGKIFIEADECGHFAEARKMTYGYGWLLKEEQGLLSARMSEKEMAQVLKPCGDPFLKTVRKKGNGER